MSILLSVINYLSDLLAPLGGASATAAAIVVFTIGVRLLLHPLSRAAFRGEKSRSRLAPQLAELQKKHSNDRQRLAEESSKMYSENGASPLAGCLPMLLQLPVFFVMYQLFSRSEIGGAHNQLLDHTLWGAPLGSHWSDALSNGGLFGAQGLVFLALFAAIAAVATWTWRRNRKTMNAAAISSAPQPGPAATLAKVMPLLSFGTVIAAAVVPLAAGIYLLTTTAWTVTERALLQHRAAAAEPVNA